MYSILYPHCPFTLGFRIRRKERKKGERKAKKEEEKGKGKREKKGKKKSATRKSY